jgi:hypothetical protein
VEVLWSSHHPFVELSGPLGIHPLDPISEVDDVEVEFRFDNEERRDRRGEERKDEAHQPSGSGDVALSNAGNRPGVRLPTLLRTFGIWVFNDLPVA